jgi:hypothetical protein
VNDNPPNDLFSKDNKLLILMDFVVKVPITLQNGGCFDGENLGR